MKSILIVGIGGFLGSILRFKIGEFVLQKTVDIKFPTGTLAVNIVGCLLIGLISGYFERYTNFNKELKFLLITGFLGGFTTFSAFGLETVNLLKKGEIGFGILNVILSVTFGLIAVWVGLKFSGIKI